MITAHGQLLNGTHQIRSHLLKPQNFKLGQKPSYNPFCSILLHFVCLWLHVFVLFLISNLLWQASACCFESQLVVSLNHVPIHWMITVSATTRCNTRFLLVLGWLHPYGYIQGIKARLCIYIYVYICIYLYVHTYVCVYMYVYIYIC